MYQPPARPNTLNRWANLASAGLLTIVVIAGLIFLNGVRVGSDLEPLNPNFVSLTQPTAENSRPDAENPEGKREINYFNQLIKPSESSLQEKQAKKQISDHLIPSLPPNATNKNSTNELNVEYIYRISDLDTTPIPIIQGKPRYPRNLVRERVEGKVLAILSVDEDGNVYDVEVEKSDYQEFAESARSAIMTWKFLPGRKEGKQVKFRMRVPVSFRLITKRSSTLSQTSTASNEFVRMPY